MAWACEKPKPPSNPIEPNNDTIKSSLKLVWKQAIDTSQSGGESHQPLVFDNKLVWNSAPFGEGYSIFLSNGENGDILWSWQNFIKHPTLPWTNFQFIYQNSYVFNNNDETHVIDLSSGINIWRYQVPNGNGEPNIVRIGDHVYHKHSSDEWPHTSVHLVRSPISYNNWDTVLSLYTDSLNDYTPAICGPTLWMKNGDSVLVFQNRSYRFGADPDGQIDFYAYNLSQKKMEFILRDIEPTGNSNVLPPVVEGDRAYVLGNRNLHCIDLKNQKILWQKGFPGPGHHLMLSNLVIDGNRLIVKPDNDAIYAMDKYTGDLIWDMREAGHSPSHMKFWNGMVFYTAEGEGKLFAVRTRDGKIIWNEDSPHDGDINYPSASFRNGVAINPDLGYIYAHDKHFMMCFELPEE